MRGICLRQIKALVISLSFVLVMWGSANSQGLYFKEGQSCIGLGLGISGDKDNMGVGFLVGGSFAGRLDLGITGSLLRNRDGSQITSVFGAGAGAYLLKQGKEDPVSLGIGITYEAASMDQEDNIQELYTWTYTGSLAHSFQSESGSRYIPEIGVAYSEMSHGHHNYSVRTGVTNYFIALHMIAPNTPFKTIAFSPALLFNENTVAVNVTIEVYFTPGRYESD